MSPALILAATCLAALTLPQRQRMHMIFVHGSYYIMWAVVLTWLAVLIRFFTESKFSFKSFVRSNWPGLAFSLVLTALIFVSIQPGYRVLADEINLLSVSKSMLYERMVDNVTEGKWYFMTFQPIERALEKRPLLFPFLTHLAHLLTGYRIENAFAVNFLAFNGVLCLLYVWFRPRIGVFWSFAMMMLVASQPVVTVSAASGGLEIIQTLFLIICFMSLQHFLENRTDLSFGFLWMNFVMLCHTRYESFIFFALGLVLLYAFKYLKAEFVSKAPLYAATPLFLLPLVWQRILMRDQFQQPEGSLIFSAEFFAKHNSEFLRNLFNFKLFYPYANLVNLAGIAALLYFVHYIFVKGAMKSRAQVHLVFFVLLIMLSSWVVFTSHFLGTMELPASARFYVMFCVGFSVLTALLLHHVSPAFVSKKVVALAVLAVFSVYHPVAVEKRFFHAQTIIRQHRIVDDFLKRLNDPDILLISNLPGFYTVRNIGAIYYPVDDERAKQVLEEYNQKLYSDIYVAQDISYATRQPTDECRLNGVFELKTLRELQNTGEYFIRISKVVNERK